MSHTRLQRLVVALDADLPVPPDVARWFLAGAKRFNRSGSGLALCECLDLTRHPADREAATRFRDCQLIKAGQHVAVKPCSTWERAGRLQAAIIDFETQHWPDIGHAEDPPSHFLDIHQHLFYAMRSGVPLPRSQRQLYNILLK